MSTERIAADLSQKPNVSLDEVAQEIGFVAAERQGLAGIKRTGGIPIAETEREMSSWLIK